MPRGDKSSYSGKQQRQAEHIEDSEKKQGRPAKAAERIAWATVNKQDGGAKGQSAKKSATKSAPKKATTKSPTKKATTKSPTKKATTAAKKSPAKKSAAKKTIAKKSGAEK